MNGASRGEGRKMMSDAEVLRSIFSADGQYPITDDAIREEICQGIENELHSYMPYCLPDCSVCARELARADLPF